MDALFITIAALAAHAGRYGITFLDDAAGPEGIVWMYYAIPGAWMAMLALCGAYSLNHLQTGMVEYQRVALASGFFASAIGIGCFLTKYDLSRGFFVLLFVIGVPALLLGRFARRQAFNRLRRQGLFQTPVLVAGSPAHVDEIARVLRREKWLGYQIVGAVTPAELEETPGGLPVLGRVCEVVDLVRDSEIDAVIFAEGSFPDSQHFKRMAWELEEHETQMIVVPALTDISSERLNPRPVAGLPLVHVERPQALQASRWIKRAFDIVGSSILLLLVGAVDGCGRDRHQAGGSRSGAVQAGPGRTPRRGVRVPQGSLDGRRRRGSQGRAGRRRTKAPACCSRWLATRESPASASSSAGSRSTRCPSSGTSSVVT